MWRWVAAVVMATCACGGGAATDPGQCGGPWTPTYTPETWTASSDGGLIEQIRTSAGTTTVDRGKVHCNDLTPDEMNDIPCYLQLPDGGTGPFSGCK